MAKVIPLQQALKVWGATFGAIVLVYFGGQLGNYLSADHTASIGVRWLGVVVAVVAIVPWLVIVALSISMVDEYYRRVALVGTALSFVIYLLAHVALNTIVDAGLAPSGFSLAEIPVAGCCWVLSVGAVMLYYRYRLQ